MNAEYYDEEESINSFLTNLCNQKFREILGRSPSQDETLHFTTVAQSFASSDSHDYELDFYADGGRLKIRGLIL